jgi:CheY-like chemotaxis protein
LENYQSGEQGIRHDSQLRSGGLSPLAYCSEVSLGGPPMTTTQYSITRTVLALIVAAIAVARVAFLDFANRIDQTSLLLLAAAIVIYLVRWERLTGFKAAGIELTMDVAQVKGAINAIELDRIENERIRTRIEFLAPFMPRVRGGRVLWIDDKPHEIVGERRLLRALGIDIMTANSSKVAEDILSADNDFDLIISDVQRVGDSYKVTGGIDIHEGVNFIVRLRQFENQAIKSLPVVFYAAYDWPRLERFTRPARATYPEPRLTNSVDRLITETVREIADARSYPIKVAAKKGPTDAQYETDAKDTGEKP